MSVFVALMWSLDLLCDAFLPYVASLSQFTLAPQDFLNPPLIVSLSFVLWKTEDNTFFLVTLLVWFDSLQIKLSLPLWVLIFFSLIALFITSNRLVIEYTVFFFRKFLKELFLVHEWRLKFEWGVLYTTCNFLVTKSHYKLKIAIRPQTGSYNSRHFGSERNVFGDKDNFLIGHPLIKT